MELSFFQPILFAGSRLDWFDSRLSNQEGNPASDVKHRTIAAVPYLAMVTLVEEECGGPVLPSTRFSWPHFSFANTGLAHS
jgi:hypothetical protein